MMIDGEDAAAVDMKVEDSVELFEEEAVLSGGGGGSCVAVVIDDCLGIAEGCWTLMRRYCLLV